MTTKQFLQLNRWLFLIGCLLFGYALLRTAWISDDAYITFRTIDNAIHGYGLRWNIAERVQSFTHPLWMLSLTAVISLTRDFTYTPIFFSLGISIAAVVVVLTRLADTTSKRLFAIAAFTFSKAYIDYATSGLENPLTHLLLACFLWIYFSQPKSDPRIFWLALLAALGAVNRQDTFLLFAPPLVLAWLEQRSWRATWLGLLGGLPLIGWELFAVAYYGFPLPNTAYAKAFGLGIDGGYLAFLGAGYLGNSLVWDPLTLTTAGLALLLALLTRARQTYAPLIGMLLYLLYVVKIGGDFMSGRFLTGPFLIGVVVLLQIGWTWRPRPARIYVGLTAVALILGLNSRAPALLNTSAYGQLPAHQATRMNARGVADERMFHYPYSGLLNPQKLDTPMHQLGRELAAEGRHVTAQKFIGVAGFLAGPEVTIVDRLALSDPLLARLPAADPTTWRIGHVDRRLPDGYLASLEQDANLIVHSGLAEFYADLRLATRGDLWHAQRWAAIWRLNTGQHDRLIEQYVAQDYYSTDQVATE